MNVKTSFCLSSSRPSSVQYLRRRKSALWMTVSLLALSLVVLTVGLISATRTDNVPVAGYYPGITVSDSRLLTATDPSNTNHDLSLSFSLSLWILMFLLVSSTLISFWPPAEFWSVSGHRWHPPGGKPQTHGESAPLTLMSLLLCHQHT